jgi:hypothetical protein
MTYLEIRPNVFNCKVCSTPCDGKTVAQFDFEHDVHFSESIENQIIDKINSIYPGYQASKTTQPGYPDIEIASKEIGSIHCYIEIKGQARTFMSVAKYLSDSGLKPSETLALNLSDLERYFHINETTQIPIILVWCLMRRPCITGSLPGNKAFYHQELSVLKNIRLHDRNNHRRFRRATGKGDVVNGQHRGVVVNYHFSINELIKGLPQF